MAGKELSAAASLPSHEEDKLSYPLAPWRRAWLERHRDELVRRVPTMDVVDRLITLHAMEPEMDVYQNIRACHEERRNERARLLLDYIASQTDKIFWDFQKALMLETCSDLAVRQDDVQAVARRFSVLELSRSTAPASSGFCAKKKKKLKGCPASVELVIEELKKRYRKRKMASLDGQASRKSLDELRVSICLLSAERLEALCGRGPQRQPFAMAKLKGKESSIVSLEDVFNADENGEVPDMLAASGIAGSGKTTAFTKKAPYEWSKEDREPAFWENISLLFEGSLAEKDWWDAKTLAEVFGLASFALTKEEEDEVVRYIRSHAEEVLLIADAMDEADVKTESLLWRVLKGDCKAVEGLKVIICSRPCERTAWLAKNCPFDRHLEVVGFTKEKIGQFIESYFRTDLQKARELQVQLRSQPDVHSFMHTPLLATMICRHFEISEALPNTQTEVFQSAVMAMLQQSGGRSSGEVPTNILAKLSPPCLHQAVISLSRLANEALSKKSVVITKTELETAGCLDDVVQLGFFSASPGTSMGVKRLEDVYTFAHHTMLEFFGAVHAVRNVVGSGEKTLSEFVDERGVDGDLARFWIFVSGLLPGELCETLLSALHRKVYHPTLYPEESRRRLLLFDCCIECASKLPKQRSETIAGVLTQGIVLRNFHLTVSNAQAVSSVIRQYSMEVNSVNFVDTTMDDAASMFLIITSLLECHNLKELVLPATAVTPQAVCGLVNLIEKNASSLTAVSIPVGDEDLPSLSPAIQKCASLVQLSIGSRSLANAAAPLVVDILRHQNRLTSFTLSGAIDDGEFSPIADALGALGETLAYLRLEWVELSPAMICRTLSPLTKLTRLDLSGVPIGDDGVCQLTEHQALPSRVGLNDVGITAVSILVLAAYLETMPSAAGSSEVLIKRSLCSSAGQDIADTMQSTSPSWKLVQRETYSTPVYTHTTLQVTEYLCFRREHGQELVVLI